MNRDSSASKMDVNGLDDVFDYNNGKEFYVRRCCVQIDAGTLPPPHINGYGKMFPLVQNGRSFSLTPGCTSLYFIARMYRHGAKIRQRNNFTFLRLEVSMTTYIHLLYC
jgi:hypothetical protein